MLKTSTDLLFEWQFLGASPRQVCVQLPSKTAALSFSVEHKEEIDIWLQRFDAIAAYLTYPDGSIKILNKEYLSVTEALEELVWVTDEIGLTMPLIRVLGTVAESKQPAGFTRIADNRQMCINKLFADALPCSPQEAVKRDIRKFTPASELDLIAQATRQRGDEETPFELSYATTLDDDRQVWSRLTVAYRLVLDAFGVPFRSGEVIGVDEIHPPVNPVFLK